MCCGVSLFSFNLQNTCWEYFMGYFAIRICLFNLIFLFFFSPTMPLGLQDLISQAGTEPGPQQWKHQIPITSSSGNFLFASLFIRLPPSSYWGIGTFIYSPEKQTYLILIKSNLLMLYFYSLCFDVLLNKTLPNSRKLRCPPVISTESFIILALTFRSVTHFEEILIQGGR